MEYFGDFLDFFVFGDGLIAEVSCIRHARLPYEGKCIIQVKMGVSVLLDAGSGGWSLAMALLPRSFGLHLWCGSPTPFVLSRPFSGRIEGSPLPAALRVMGYGLWVARFRISPKPVRPEQPRRGRIEGSPFEVVLGVGFFCDLNGLFVLA